MHCVAGVIFPAATVAAAVYAIAMMAHTVHGMMFMAAVKAVALTAALNLQTITAHVVASAITTIA